MNAADLPTSPIFIGGMFRSGTTLLRAMLGQHSSIASGLETYWFDIDWNAKGTEGFLERMERVRSFYGVDEARMRDIVTESGDSVEFLNRFLGGYASSLGKRRWAEKTPGNLMHLDSIIEGWPQAKIIHIRRNPRDVYASLKQSGKWDTVCDFVSRWCAMLGAVEAAKGILPLDDGRFLEVQYERLVTNPRQVMGSVVEFLGEPWEDRVAEFQGKEDEFHIVNRLTGKSSTTLRRLQQPLSLSRIGIGQVVVGDEELNAIRRSVQARGLLTIFDQMLAESDTAPGR